jgi:hypothetical protein
MFIYVSKSPYTYVYGDHEGAHKNAKVPFGLKLEVISGPYDSAYQVKPPPEEYSAAYEQYPENWIAAADVSLTPVVPEPEPQPEPQPEPEDGDTVLPIEFSPAVTMQIKVDITGASLEEIKGLIKAVKE